MTKSISPYPKIQAFDSNGDPLVGGKLYTYAAGTTTPATTWTTTVGNVANTNPVILDSRGECNVYLTAGTAYKFVLKTSADVTIWTVDQILVPDTTQYFTQTGSGAVQRTVTAKLAERITPFDFGAVGDNSTNDLTAIQAALTAAKALVNEPGSRLGYGGRPWVDLCGYTFKVNDAVNMDAMGGVLMGNGMIVANSSGWPATTPVIRMGLNTGHDDDRYVGLFRLNVECSTVADGVYAQNIRSSFIDQCDIHGMRTSGYGLRVFGSNGGDCVFSRVRASQYWFGEAGYDTLANRTATGISDEIRDNRFLMCEAFYCGVPVNISNGGSHIWIGGHSFNGLAAPTTWTITGAANNGSGLIRLTFASTTGLANNDLICMPWLSGIASNGGTKAGVYKITVIDSTHIDIQSSTFAGAYTGSGQTIMKYDDEPIVCRINSAATSVIMRDCQFDNGKVVIEAYQSGVGAKCSLDGCLFLKSADGYQRCGVEIYNDGGAGVTSSGIAVTNNYFNGAYPPVRFTAINGGSFASLQKCSINGNHRADGEACVVYGKSVLYDGTGPSAPGAIFTAGTTDEDETDTPTNDANTGLYHPAADQIGITTAATRRAFFDDVGNVAFGDGQIADAATNGFVYFPTTTAGAPTGVPATTYSGLVPMVIDDTNFRIYIRMGGAWKMCQLA